MYPDMAREQIVAALDAIDAAYSVIRGTSTDVVGNGFRVELAARLESQARVNWGLSVRVFAEAADPPDGPAPGVAVRNVLASRLRITMAEVKRRMRVGVRVRPRRSLTGPPVAPELPVLAQAVAAGAVGADHVGEVCTALDRLPAAVGPAERDEAERVLVEHARTQDAEFVAEVGRKLGEVLNPDGRFDDSDRQRRRGLTLGRQGLDGMSRLSGWLTPEARAYVEAVGAAVRPGHHLPGSEQAVVDGATDTRSDYQRLHDAVAWGLRTAMASGGLGRHRGMPVTVVARTTAAELEQAARAVADPSVPMPAPARTGGGSSLPMRDLIRMAGAGSMQYLAVFEDHSERPLYLARARVASVDQRIICYARDGGCTRPGCTVPGYRCEVHHEPAWLVRQRTDTDHLFFGCGPDHQGITDGIYRTEITPQGRLAWTDGTQAPRTNTYHHPEQLLRDAHSEQHDGDQHDEDDQKDEDDP